MIDGSTVTQALEYPLATDSRGRRSVSGACCSTTRGDDDSYGVIRAEVLRRTATARQLLPRGPDDHHRNRLHGPFHQVPDWLYFRRDHPDRADRVPARCAPGARPGPAPGGPAAASGRAAVRRIHLGLRHGDPARPAVARGPARVLPLPGPVDGGPRGAAVLPGRPGRTEQQLPAGAAPSSRSTPPWPAGRGGPRDRAGFTGRRERPPPLPGWDCSVCSARATSATTPPWTSYSGTSGPTIPTPSWTPCAQDRRWLTAHTASMPSRCYWYHKHEQDARG